MPETTFTEFNDLSLSEPLLKALADIGFAEPTPIQRAAIPAILSGKDITAQAQTGSGKTAAYGLPILHGINTGQDVTQALIVCPTRELAEQITKEIKRFCRYMPEVNLLSVYGGHSFQQQAKVLEKGAHIVVGTPGRLLDHIRRESLKPENIQTVVLDEADKMLDMGFLEEIEELLKAIPQKKQVLLFSATMPGKILALARTYQEQPKKISLGGTEEKEPEIQKFFIETAYKKQVLLKVIDHYNLKLALIFCNTKLLAKELADDLKKEGFVTDALHGDLEQQDRDKVMLKFRNHSINFLVATDIAARGIDVQDVQAVINYELAPTKEDFTHRIGRTGRAGRTGIAISLLDPKEKNKLENIAKYAGLDVGNKLSEKELKPHISEKRTIKPATITLYIGGGKKQKLRKADILGAITAETRLKGEEIGRIDIFEYFSYVAVPYKRADEVIAKLQAGNIKSKKFKIQKMS